jgi:hypothetical protein
VKIKTIILPVVLYVCTNWSLAVGQEGVCERGAEGRGEVTGGLTEVHNGELHVLYSSRNIISYYNH